MLMGALFNLHARGSKMMKFYGRHKQTDGVLFAVCVKKVLHASGNVYHQSRRIDALTINRQKNVHNLTRAS